MTIQTLDADEWTTVTTTETDTVFYNRGASPIFVSTEDTTSADIDDGLPLLPGEAIVLADGYAVTASCIGAPTEVFWMPIGIPPA
jgi:hypothetical protein